MFENTIKNITTGRQEMFDSGLKMYKEMCPNDNPNNWAQAREARFVMGNLQTMYQKSKILNILLKRALHQDWELKNNPSIPINLHFFHKPGDFYRFVEFFFYPHNF